MKKLFLFALPLSLLACGGKSKSAKEIAQEICDCSSKANGLPATDPNRSKAQADCMKMQQDGWEKVQRMETVKVDEYNSILSACASEQIKKSFGK